MTIIYREFDGDLNHLSGKTVCVVGFGTLGQPAAVNLRESGVAVIVTGEADDISRAEADGFLTDKIGAAVQKSTITMMMLSDEAMKRTYITHVSPNLKRGDTLIFSSGYNIAFGYIEAPPFVDVGLIAPRTVGGALRVRYAADNAPFYSFVAVGQDASGRAWDTVLGLSLALGVLRAGAVEVTLEQEAELSLFIQQAILPAVQHMMVSAAELLLKHGYPPEAALTDLYLSGKFTEHLQQAARSGLLETLEKSTMTGQYGTLSRLERFTDLKMDRLMVDILENIRNGTFAQEWTREYADGHLRLNKLIKQQSDQDIWELEQQTLDMMGRFDADPPPFIDDDTL